VVFDFRLGRGREGPKAFLGNFEGLLQTDGYAAYDKVGGPKLVHAACWSHSRSKPDKTRHPFGGSEIVNTAAAWIETDSSYLIHS